MEGTTVAGTASMEGGGGRNQDVTLPGREYGAGYEDDGLRILRGAEDQNEAEGRLPPSPQSPPPVPERSSRRFSKRVSSGGRSV